MGKAAHARNPATSTANGAPGWIRYTTGTKIAVSTAAGTIPGPRMGTCRIAIVANHSTKAPMKISSEIT